MGPTPRWEALPLAGTRFGTAADFGEAARAMAREGELSPDARAGDAVRRASRFGRAFAEGNDSCGAALREASRGAARVEASRGAVRGEVLRGTACGEASRAGGGDGVRT